MMCNSRSAFAKMVRTHPSVPLDVKDARKVSADDVRDHSPDMVEKGSGTKLDWADDEEDDPELWQNQVKSYLAS